MTSRRRSRFSSCGFRRPRIRPPRSTPSSSSPKRGVGSSSSASTLRILRAVHPGPERLARGARSGAAELRRVLRLWTMCSFCSLRCGCIRSPPGSPGDHGRLLVRDRAGTDGLSALPGHHRDPRAVGRSDDRHNAPGGGAGGVAVRRAAVLFLRPPTTPSGGSDRRIPLAFRPGIGRVLFLGRRGVGSSALRPALLHSESATSRTDYSPGATRGTIPP